MRKKHRQALESLFASPPDTEYFEDDIRGIHAYFAFQKEKHPDAFFIDDTTWGDLAMGEVYKRVNATLSTSGEQVLYHMLRAPAMDKGTYAQRAQLVDLVAEEPTLRLSLQAILQRVGKRRAANTTEAFHPSAHSPALLLLTIGLMLALLGCILGLFFSSLFAYPLLALLFCNALYHTYMMHRMERDMATVNYSVAMVAACRRMRKLAHPRLREHLHAFFEAGERAKSIARTRAVTMTTTSDLVTYINIFLLLDILAYERLKNRLARYHADIFLIHETLGALDASIAIAGFRKRNAHAIPSIDYAGETPPYLRVAGLAHPLLAQPVRNDLHTAQPLLVTGSNASGKSTFLKAVAINALLAQSICTVCCTAYAATSFYLYSSMAIADNVLAGDSYFIAEIKSIKRIVDAAARGERILCVIDEVLRGTNTVERIAASSALLRALLSSNVLCLAATHDGELCALLPGYRQMHFAETIADSEIVFDYLLKEGPATTRNAIKLLSLLGFDEDLVGQASMRAEGYMATGQWAI